MFFLMHKSPLTVEVKHVTSKKKKANYCNQKKVSPSLLLVGNLT